MDVILVVRAYRTISNFAMQVLAGCALLYLEARARAETARAFYLEESKEPMVPVREPHPLQAKVKIVQVEQNS